MNLVKRSPRFPAPDIARGFMLLLISLANVAFWCTRASVEENRLTIVDQVWLFIRTCFVDQRAFPLFAILFGFGLAVMIKRVHEQSGDPAGTKESQRAARKLIRRRAWWMLLVGLVHSIIFMADIIGTYAFAALICAGMLAGARRKTLIVVSIINVLLAFSLMPAPDEIGGKVDALAKINDTLPISIPFILNPFLWLVNSISVVFVGGILAYVALGYFIAQTSWLTHPLQHKKLLTAVAVVGLGIAAVLGAPAALLVSAFSNQDPLFLEPWYAIGGVAGALGWLAVFGLVAARVQTKNGVLLPGNSTEELPPATRGVVAVGRRSMSAYIAQSVAFFSIFGIARLTGVIDHITPIIGAVLAVVVWGVILWWCLWLDKAGKPGPAEKWLRAKVYKQPA